MWQFVVILCHKFAVNWISWGLRQNKQIEDITVASEELWMPFLYFSFINWWIKWIICWLISNESSWSPSSWFWETKPLKKPIGLFEKHEAEKGIFAFIVESTVWRQTGNEGEMVWHATKVVDIQSDGIRPNHQATGSLQKFTFKFWRCMDALFLNTETHY